MSAVNEYRQTEGIRGYTFHADIFCVECGEKLPAVDPEGNDKHPVFSSDVNEWIDNDTKELEAEGEEFMGIYCSECSDEVTP